MLSTILQWALTAILSCLGIAAVIPFVLEAFRPDRDFKDKHCVITGGSKGIGKEVAIKFAEEGAQVTIIARSKSGLAKAAKEIRNISLGARVHVEEADCTDYNQLCQAIKNAELSFGPVDVLVANAGTSRPGLFLDQDYREFKRQMEVNYLGTVHAIKAVANGMCIRRDGLICIVSSGICCGSFLGYASYAPTKYALRGLADSLRNEFCGHNVDVCICYPPDTDTDGFVEENKTKPKETLLISPPELYSSEKVASGIMRGMKSGAYHIQGPDLIQNLAITSSATTSPRQNTVLEVFIIGPIISLILTLFRMFHMDPIAKRHGNDNPRTLNSSSPNNHNHNKRKNSTSNSHNNNNNNDEKKNNKSQKSKKED